MLTRMRNLLELGWKLVSTSAAARLNDTDQTKSSWAKLIESYASLPEVYKGFFESFLADGREFPYTVLTPSYEGFIHRTTEKLICNFGCEIYILERTGDSFEVQCYPIEEISYVEVRTILLDSRIKISGVTRQGVPASSTIKFNSITDYLFAPLLERIRLAACDSVSEVQSSELEKFAGWISSNYKFMSYAKRSLLGGEKVLSAILQPEIRERKFKVLGKTFYRTVSPTHMSILTDRELILIREDEKQIGDERYGGIWDYIPLNKIETLSLSRKGDNLLVLSIQLTEKSHLECVFQVSTQQEIDQLLRRIEEKL